MASHDNLYGIGAFRIKAKRVLPKMVFDFADGGSETETTLQRNETAFSDWEFLPRPMKNVGPRDLSLELFKTKLSLPVIIGPTGFSGLFWPRGELASARAAHSEGTIYVMSHASTVTIEDLAEGTSGSSWFQNFIFRDRGLTRSFTERAANSNYTAMVVTIDNQVPGYRARDVQNGFVVPPRLTLRNGLDVLRHPGWVRKMLTQRDITFANYATAEQSNMVALSEYMASNLDPDIGWDDFEDVRNLWSGPLLVKGILHPRDAIEAINRGADGIIVSNHGGRQLDGAIATIDALPGIADAVQGKVPILLDGGVRRGLDVLRARILGATACLIGRPQLWGLAIAGEQGVRQVLGVYRTEMERAMALCGWSSLADLSSEDLIHRRSE